MSPISSQTKLSQTFKTSPTSRLLSDKASQRKITDSYFLKTESATFGNLTFHFLWGEEKKLLITFKSDAFLNDFESIKPELEKDLAKYCGLGLCL